MTPQDLNCKPTTNKTGQDVEFKTVTVDGFPAWFPLALFVSGLTILVAVPVQHHFFSSQTQKVHNMEK